MIKLRQFLVLMLFLLQSVSHGAGGGGSHCAKNIPQRDNFVATTLMVYQAINCLSDRIDSLEQQLAGKPEPVLQIIPAMKYDSLTYLQPAIAKNGDKAILSIYFTNQLNEEKTITVSLMDLSAKLQAEVLLKSKDKSSEQIDINQIKKLPEQFKGYALIKFNPAVDPKSPPILPVIFLTSNG
ncbi:hypothetical protein [Legionella shakespearei]|uniref:Uncharacterized protein n=1 Tax=Legionella shakespearei DSM 23087 TaxID=1122169 RepID=A0A0W0YLR7_9GAMM|nr:hypothetical protein [Legionella shakespearei]KTD57478.1 hypothetical protein Lsha_2319 [Legionella shakespearei DSM 23087]